MLIGLVVLALMGFAKASIDQITIDPTKRTFIDGLGRERIFHGVNAVYKIAPWHPVLTGMDSNNTLSIEDAKVLASYGLNIVRLGVMWPGIEPGAEGKYDSSYLDACETIVDNLASEGIYAILDVHQDLWHRKYCGEGVPDWVQAKCAADYTGKPFPSPVVQNSYPVDKNGNPELDSCLSKSFFTYYLAHEVGASFQCLYNNHDDLWTSFGNVWKTIAERFKDKPNVLGYELLNEPWMGDVNRHPHLLLPGETEKKFLEPMYTHLNNMIREVDDKKIIFFEGITIDYWPSGFQAAPGPASYNNRQAIAYHIYCMPDPNKAEAVLCSGADDAFFAMRRKDSERLGVPTIMTEFGATVSQRGSLHDLSSLVRQSALHTQSWMYWQYKYYADLTTCTPSGESLWNNDGTPALDKLAVLTQPYPAAIAGTLDSFEFDDKRANTFVLTYSLLTTLPADNTDAATTVVRLNAAMHYPTGLAVSITGSGAANVTFQCVDRSQINILQNSASGSAQVVVTISANCGDARNKCDCSF